MKPEFLEPATFLEASSLLAEYGYDAKILAGGTAVVLMLQQKLIAPSVLVSLGSIRGHDTIQPHAGGLRIGALSSLRALELSPELRAYSPALAGAFAVVGNVRVRNQATLGGNLAEADYASDPPTMLLALDARVRAVGQRGEREIPLEEFILGFYTTALEIDEVIESVFIPELPQNARAVYLRFTSRSTEDRPCVGVGAVADLGPDGTCRELRLAVGAAVERPSRLPGVEAMARGSKLTDELISSLAEGYARSLDPLSDARGSAWYRREMIQVFVKRALLEVRDGTR